MLPTLKPMLPEWLFDENGEISYSFLTNSSVTLHNQSRKATYNATVDYMIIDGERVDGDVYTGCKIDEMRNGKAVKIDIYYK